MPESKNTKHHCCPGVIPTPIPGWQMKLLDDCCTVEYTYKTPAGNITAIWLWKIKQREWAPPFGHPDPNPVAPDGVPLAGPGTM